MTLWRSSLLCGLLAVTSCGGGGGGTGDPGTGGVGTSRVVAYTGYDVAHSDGDQALFRIETSTGVPWAEARGWKLVTGETSRFVRLDIQRNGTSATLVPGDSSSAYRTALYLRDVDTWLLDFANSATLSYILAVRGGWPNPYFTLPGIPASGDGRALGLWRIEHLVEGTESTLVPWANVGPSGGTPGANWELLASTVAPLRPDGQSRSTQFGTENFQRREYALITHAGKLWILGGGALAAQSSRSSLPLNEYVDQVWSSSDGVNWNMISQSGPPYDILSGKTVGGPRARFGCASFGGRIWLFGGLVGSGVGREERNKESYVGLNGYLYRCNEIWSSADGATWTYHGNGPWSERTSPTVIVQNGELWMLGGKVGADTYADLRDAWRSRDGVTWDRMTFGGVNGSLHPELSFVYQVAGRVFVWANTYLFSTLDGTSVTVHDTSGPAGERFPWSRSGGVQTGVMYQTQADPRYLNQVVSHGGKAYLFPGARRDDEPFYARYGAIRPTSEVWETSDGVSWQLAQVMSPPAARTGHRVCAYGQHIYLVGGMSNYVGFDPANSQPIPHGGTADLRDVWRWDPAAWDASISSQGRNSGMEIIGTLSSGSPSALIQPLGSAGSAGGSEAPGDIRPVPQPRPPASLPWADRVTPWLQQQQAAVDAQKKGQFRSGLRDVIFKGGLLVAVGAGIAVFAPGPAKLIGLAAAGGGVYVMVQAMNAKITDPTQRHLQNAVDALSDAEGTVSNSDPGEVPEDKSK